MKKSRNHFTLFVVYKPTYTGFLYGWIRDDGHQDSDQEDSRHFEIFESQDTSAPSAIVKVFDFLSTVDLTLDSPALVLNLKSQ